MEVCRSLNSHFYRSYPLLLEYMTNKSVKTINIFNFTFPLKIFSFSMTYLLKIHHGHTETLLNLLQILTTSVFQKVIHCNF